MRWKLVREDFFSRIQEWFTIFLAKSLMIEKLFVNLLFSRIYFEFTIFSRIYFEFTIFFCKFTLNFLFAYSLTIPFEFNSLWIHYLFHEFTYNSLWIQFAMNSLSISRIRESTFNSIPSSRIHFSLFIFSRIHFQFTVFSRIQQWFIIFLVKSLMIDLLFREFTMNFLSSSRIHFEFTIEFSIFL